MRFSVTGINGRSVKSAKLRLRNINPSNAGGDFYRIPDGLSTCGNWSESTVNWNNAPASETTALASLGAVALNTWYEVDITPLITGDGAHCLRVKSASIDGATYYSKEQGGLFAPQLVVTLQ
jgi:hypothetical protein